MGRPPAKAPPPPPAPTPKGKKPTPPPPAPAGKPKQAPPPPPKGAPSPPVLAKVSPFYLNGRTAHLKYLTAELPCADVWWEISNVQGLMLRYPLVSSTHHGRA